MKSQSVTITAPSFGWPTTRSAVLLLGGVLFVLGLFLDHRSAWTGYLLGFSIVAGLALAGAFFLAVLHVARARWADSLRPILEAMASLIPLAGGLGLGVIVGCPTLYPWASGHEDLGHLVHHKLWWLNPTFFGIRLVLYFALWIWIATRLVRHSRKSLDEPASAASAYRYSIAFLAVFGVTFSLASWDWFLSLEPEWFSTIYTLQILAGLGTSGLGLVMILAARARQAPQSPFRVSEAQLDDLGKIGLALTLFWAYIGFCQSMLIWYTNMPEETSWALARSTKAWRPLTLLNLLLNWLIPFCVLMPRTARRSSTVLFRVGLLLLVGRLVDLYVLLGPPLMAEAPKFGIFVLAPIVAAALLFAWRLQVQLLTATNRAR